MVRWTLLVAHDRPDLVSALVLIDITPGVNADKARHITGQIYTAVGGKIALRMLSYGEQRADATLIRSRIETAVRFRESLGIARWDVFGHSWGGVVITQAGDDPKV